jgi:hypothetical protein
MFRQVGEHEYTVYEILWRPEGLGFPSSSDYWMDLQREVLTSVEHHKELEVTSWKWELKIGPMRQVFLWTLYNLSNISAVLRPYIPSSQLWSPINGVQPTSWEALSSRWVPMFWRNNCLHLLWWRLSVPLKHWCSPFSLHKVIIWQTTIWTGMSSS